MNITTIELYSKILEAVLKTAKVQVIRKSYPDLVLEGVARHVVKPDSIAFASDWTPESRLRITATMEIFVPLGDIEEIYIKD